MISKYGIIFASSPNEIGYINLKIIVSIVIFIIPHMPWNLKPITILKALLSKLMNLLKEKMQMKIFKSSMALYSNRNLEI